MPNCPKCNTEYNEGLKKCEGCGESLIGANVDKVAPAHSPLDLIMHTFKYYWPVLLAVALFVIMQWSFPLVDWWKSWNKKNTYYSHGPLVPLITLFMVWANRKRIALVKIQPSWLGLLVILLSIPIFMFGRWTGSGNMCGITFITFLVGATLLFTGLRMTRLLLFPMLYLVFMIPASATVLDSATFKIQYASTTLAAKILSICGQSIMQVGTTISGGDLPGDLQIAAACSGFRMLIALLTFTTFFVYMLRTPAWKKAFLVLFSLPLSLFVNGLRIAVIGFIGIWSQSAETMHNFHDTWAMVFELVLSFAILFAVARLIKANDFGIPDPVVDPEISVADNRPPAWKLIGRGFRGTSVIVIFCLIILMNMILKPLDLTAKGHLVRTDFPKTFGSWTSQDVPLDEITKSELKTADMMTRIYTDGETGRQVLVLVSAAKDSDAFHDPHSCFTGGGATITQDKTVVLDLKKPRPIKAPATLLVATGPSDPQLVLYWYICGSEVSPSTSGVRKQMRIQQVHDQINLLLHPNQRDNITKLIGKRQWYWLRFITVSWDDPETTDLEFLKQFVNEYLANTKKVGE